MLAFFYGQDSYRRREKIKEIITAYRQKHPYFDFGSFDLTENIEVYPAMKDFLSQQSLFENFKLVLAKGIFEIEKPKIKFLLENQLNKENSLLIISEAKKPAKDFEFLVREPVHHQEFGDLTAEKMVFWFKKEAQKRNLEFNAEAEKYLWRWQKCANADTWTLVNELNKIAAADLPQPITAEYLQEILLFSSKEDIFKLAGLLTGKNSSSQKIIALEKLLTQKESPAYIFNLLGYRSPGSLISKLADYDWLIKSGNLDYEEALLDLVLTNI